MVQTRVYGVEQPLSCWSDAALSRGTRGDSTRAAAPHILLTHSLSLTTLLLKIGLPVLMEAHFPGLLASASLLAPRAQTARHGQPRPAPRMREHAHCPARDRRLHTWQHVHVAADSTSPAGAHIANMLFSMVHGRRDNSLTNEHASLAVGIETGDVSFSSSRTDVTKSDKKTALIHDVGGDPWGFW